ncbi:MAG: hypothetical protein RBS36_02460 [Thiomicrospira sp.]|jgi:hypothetical protein|nr:hypothetical protein [Thiomicrospira sp.]
MRPELIAHRLALLGREDYLQLLSNFERDYPKYMAELSTSQTLRNGLHSLKGMSYAAGFEEVGNKIADIEHMLHNGASVTVRIHLKSIAPAIEDALHQTKAYLAKIANE